MHYYFPTVVNFRQVIVFLVEIDVAVDRNVQIRHQPHGTALVCEIRGSQPTTDETRVFREGATAGEFVVVQHLTFEQSGKMRISLAGRLAQRVHGVEQEPITSFLKMKLVSRGHHDIDDE